MNATEVNLSILKEIKNTIDKNANKENNLGLVSGISGIMIFRFLLSRVLECEKEFEKAKSLITEGLEKINDGYNDPSYGNGIAGFFWALQFLQENSIIEIDNDAIFCQIEDYIYEAMDFSIKNRNYDFLYGAIGYGMFFLKRYKTIENPNLKNKYLKILEELIAYLHTSKIENTHGIMWQSPQESDVKNEINIDLGLAHGVPSILYFLCLVYEEGLCKEKIRPLIKGINRYMLSTKNISKNMISLFPTYQYLSLKKEEHISRLGWCYGDIGIGLSLLKAADVTKDVLLKKEAISILIHSSKRRDLKQNSVLDAGICHGTYGLFHIYGKLFKKTKINYFKEASIHWKEVSDDMVKYDEDQNIYYSIHLGDRNWSNPYSLLEGLSGIGLSIISDITNHKIEWDECLFI